MSSASLKSLLGGVILLASPLALADSTTSIPAFEAKISAARTATSPGGTTILREEMAEALQRFFETRTGVVDAAERAYLGTKVNDATFLTGVAADAKQYLDAFYELNDAATTAAPLYLGYLQESPADLYGADGPLAQASTIVEGFIPYGQGVANQLTLLTAIQNSQELGYGSPYVFVPITQSELEATLSGTAGYDYETPSQEEVDGAAAFITYISRNSNRLYKADWACFRGCQGDVGGYIIASVSTDRRFVRVVKVVTWVE
ncbi:hypothetical protein HPC49_07195 [Pyxidicoccus fallax]|uniref:Uncharacterized protein n=1 Tax=Pyxidicoccus fallax TaxID=394095 RepID=A0A848LTK9_9BACT|nr:hypothetical protein [Pyxidicoccus fallax]NMO20942.1 hypothetical protein [Pyxidicoccus fallax]NPC78037.1 hypothetical protein [Pyxidicoccus fallax]